MYQIKYYIVCLLLLSTSASHAVSLQNGDILHFTSAAGSEIFGFGASGQVADRADLDALNGIIIGTAQPTVPDLGQEWTSDNVGVIGNHRTTTAISVIDGSTLDFSGWVMTVGTDDYAFGATNGLATYTFDGTSFTLSYSWDANIDNGGIALGPLAVTTYNLFLAGTVSQVPLPPAMWLFGSGLLGLISLSRHKNAN
ncbi:MAG: hypothetical protein EP297_08665 [Gammaproteobacteria bacterium]|nr:MAG: hypothetical protein EP297_08665 [Gammaproteobacteria bacterium]